MDFYNIAERSNFHGRGNGRTLDSIDIYPDFLVTKSEDLMIKGRSFYAVWDEAKGMWSQDEFDVQRLVDADMYSYRDALMKSTTVDCPVAVLSMKSSRSKTWKEFKQYVSLLPDNYHELDEKLTFLNSEVRKEDYVSKKLGYALEAGDYSAWETLVDKLYSKGEREKIEWAIGAIVSGDSKKIQKFCVFYGEAGSGKSTIINIIQRLFEGYYFTFDAKALGSANNQFATEAFRSNPLVAIQHDGDLSRIEDNTRINSIVSHEMMTIKEKFKPEYMSRANCFLFMGTNKPVKITDAKSGIIRRLIDIHPTGQRFSPKEYDALISQIDFQLGAIAQHCLEVYRELGKNYYKNYIPQDMIMKTDVFYNFVEAKCEEFERQSKVDGGVGLKQAYAMYKDYCDEAMLEYKLPMYKFREELKNYFERFDSVARIGPEQKQVRSCYVGFLKEKLEPPVLKREVHSLPLVLDSSESLLDICLADCPAQYAVERDGNEAPEKKWSDVTTTLKDIDTTKLHYVRPMAEWHGMKLIMIDLDIRNENGEKDMLKNLEAASKFPRTYAEFSKGGAGIHLIYWYEGDVSKLALIFAPGIEIKHFRGNAAMRRRLSKCNNVPIAVMAVGGLPLKEEKMIDILQLKDELHLRNIIKKCLKKKNHGATRPEVDLIRKVLDDAYASGMKYDVSDMQHDIFVFALNSTNQSDYCVKQLKFMKFKSEETEEEKAEREKNEKAVLKTSKQTEDNVLTFFDIEIYPPGIDSEGEENEGLFLVCWKNQGEGNSVVSMVNPSPAEIESLFSMKLVGFNCRGYDNHMLYARYLGYSNADLYDLSRRIIVENARDALFKEAYNISYTDVYDFASKKQGLKKWEIELGIHHMEMDIPWDQPAPKSMWNKVIEYCCNDVIATEKVFEKRCEDWKARQILADLAGGTVNDTTNQLTTKIVFGNNRNPTLVYTDLATGKQYEGR